MNYSKLKRLKKLYFSHLDVASTFTISENSARVLCTRYVKKGYFIRMKRDIYILSAFWENIDLKEKFIIANILQVPSYVSLTTALSYYGYTTQVQQNFIESIALMRTTQIEIEGSIFRYTRIRKKLYSGFERVDDIFIALPEKAVLDAFYLHVLGRYTLDLSALEPDKFDYRLIKKFIKGYPPKIRSEWEKYERVKRP